MNKRDLEQVDTRLDDCARRLLFVSGVVIRSADSVNGRLNETVPPIKISWWVGIGDSSNKR